MAAIDFFDQGWRKNPDGAAYVLGERAYTFQEIRDLSCQISHALIATGSAPETKVAVWSLNDPIAWTCVLATWRGGMTWVPVNPRSSSDDNAHILDAFDCEILFFQRGFAEVIDAIRPQLPKLKHAICLEEALAGTRSLQQFIDGHPTTPPVVDHGMDDVVMLGPTGGTTGLPKGVMNTNRNIATFFAQWSMTASYRPDDPVVNLAAAPMTHTAGNVSLPATARGGTVVILEKPDPAAILEAIEQRRVTELFLPPTVIYMLLDYPGVEQRDFSSLRYFMYGAAPMSLEKLRQAIDVFGPVMMEGYGQMEAFASIAYLAPEEHFVDGHLAPDGQLSSCGRPAALTNVMISDEANQALPPGQSGEICVRGDIVMKGYYKAPDKTAETIIDGWLHTGDIGHLDDRGYLHLTDRKKDMIISGGFNVYPSEVEQVIWSHPAVLDCAVIGVPDDKWGEAVKAVVELNSGMQVEAAELLALCRERLGGVKTPKSIDFVDQLPRSANGKVLKKALRQPGQTIAAQRYYKRS
ncbi:MAG: AMP-binding protein [Hyphomicrobiaceae bacterium]